eukprot:Hpha_TRINITY_DN12994_c0_g1::TRINITY_DN12994_c0_g1_i4::g.164374::m.164374
MGVFDALVWVPKLYLRGPIYWTVGFLCGPYAIIFEGIGLLCMVAAFAGLLWGFTNLVDEPRDLGALHAFAHSYAAPFAIIVPHFVLSYLAKKQFRVFQSGASPPAPCLYVFLVGKMFMAARIMMAYSSGVLGTTIDFFIKGEVIMIGFHTLCCVAWLSRKRYDPHLVDDVWEVIVSVFVIDCVKTVLVGWMFVGFERGTIADLVDRLPTMNVQGAAFIVTHVVLDILQSCSTTFSLFIAEAARKLWSRDPEGKDTETGKATTYGTHETTGTRREHCSCSSCWTSWKEALAVCCVAVIDVAWYRYALGLENFRRKHSIEWPGFEGFEKELNEEKERLGERITEKGAADPKDFEACQAVALLRMVQHLRELRDPGAKHGATLLEYAEQKRGAESLNQDWPFNDVKVDVSIIFVVTSVIVMALLGASSYLILRA